CLLVSHLDLSHLVRSLYSFRVLLFLCIFCLFSFLFFFLMLRPPPTSTLFPYTTLFRSAHAVVFSSRLSATFLRGKGAAAPGAESDRKSTRLNSSHQIISYAVFCLKKKKNKNTKSN